MIIDFNANHIVAFNQNIYLFRFHSHTVDSLLEFGSGIAF